VSKLNCPISLGIVPDSSLICRYLSNAQQNSQANNSSAANTKSTAYNQVSKLNCPISLGIVPKSLFSSRPLRTKQPSQATINTINSLTISGAKSIVQSRSVSCQTVDYCSVPYQQHTTNRPANITLTNTKSACLQLIEQSQ
jgi:hypothetical protein